MCELAHASVLPIKETYVLHQCLKTKGDKASIRPHINHPSFPQQVNLVLYCFLLGINASIFFNIQGCKET